MSRVLFGKLAIIASLMLLLLIPLQMISGLVYERKGQRDHVLEDIAQSASGPQQITGPVLVIPYQVKSITQERNINTGAVSSKEVFTDHQLTILPERLDITGQATTETRYRGLYRALMYTAETQLNGQFQVNNGTLFNDPNVHVGQPYVAVGVSDVRGIRNTPKLSWQGVPFAFQPGAKLSVLGSGIHAPLPSFDPKVATTYRFSLPLTVLGMENISFTPVGKDTNVKLGANWPHPSFYGRFLPASREIRHEGFNADWQTSWFATNLDQEFQQAVAKGESSFHTQDFGVSFIQPVDVYQQTERAIKYGLLFVLLTFTAFFLFEMLKTLRIHAVQYGLVGAALAMFYLLLIALSEHMTFLPAYLIASGACIGLLTFYLSHVLHHWLRGMGFGAMLSLLYATLYGLLQSEDNALLLGALLLFAVLAAVMVLTRRLDWYSIGSLGAMESSAPSKQELDIKEPDVAGEPSA